MAHRIKELIKEKGYTQETFAKKLGITRGGFIQLLESPSYPSLERIATALDVDMWQLFASPVEVAKETKGETCPYCGQPITIKTTIEKA